MLKRLTRRRLAPGTVMGALALFISLSGAAYAATGGNFILGQPNTATSSTQLSASGATTNNALKVTNSNTATGATALELNVPAGHAPLKVNRSAKVALLNVDFLDGLDSLAFIRKGVALSAAVTAAGGVVDVTNTGTTNGVQGKAADPGASGVYGENTSGQGFGVAGRADTFGKAVYGDNTGGGWAGYFEDAVYVGSDLSIGGALQCAGCVGPSDIGGKVDDADKLDGIDSAGFIQGNGAAAGQAVAIQPGTNLFLGPPLLGFLRFIYACPSTLSNNGTLGIYNDSGSIANVFIDSGGANPTYTQLGNTPGTNFINLPAAAAGDSYHIQAQGSLGILTVEAATVNRSGDCHVQVQGLLTR
jgi:hypothetical protein